MCERLKRLGGGWRDAGCDDRLLISTKTLSLRIDGTMLWKNTECEGDTSNSGIWSERTHHRVAI
jgi:hypothetical protein